MEHLPWLLLFLNFRQTLGDFKYDFLIALTIFVENGTFQKITVLIIQFSGQNSKYVQNILRQNYRSNICKKLSEIQENIGR